MKRVSLIFCLVQSVCLWAQESPDGVLFEKNVTWEQVLAKAKMEHKHVFVDCFASWCLPCKKMDEDVFSKRAVGDFMNARFISVRIQMDTSRNDDDELKRWYQVAHRIQDQFNVRVYPTYLFFSADGEIVHRYLSSIPESKFMKVAGNALDPDKQYYSLLNAYRNGHKKGERLGYLAALVKSFEGDSLAKVIATDYLRYTNSLKNDDLMQKKYFDFINVFPSLLSSRDKLFGVLYRNGVKVDSIEQRRKFAELMVQSIISKEEVDNRLASVAADAELQPSFWEHLNNRIRKKYNSYYAGLVVTNAQITWYLKKKDMPQFIKFKIKLTDQYGLDTAGLGWVYINNFAWNYVFKYCNNIDTLDKVARWMQIVVGGHPDDYVSIDTYANLLFKVGKTNDAITLEERAVELERQAAQREKRGPNLSYDNTLEKMKAGIPTWLVQ